MAPIDPEWKQLLMSSQPMNLPSDIELNILSRLPVKSILRCKLVCKKWYILLEDASFIQTHLNRSIQAFDGFNYIVQTDTSYVGRFTGFTGPVFFLNKENFEESFQLRLDDKSIARYNIVASINGILCIAKFPECLVPESMLLWNPAIRELKVLPKIPDQPRRLTYLGFGFDLKSNDYKVVKIFPDDDLTTVNVFSLRRNGWRALVVDRYEMFTINGANANGRLHWVVARWLGNAWTDKLIVSFDVTDEKIVEMDLPDIGRKKDVRLLESPKSLGKSLLLSVCNNEEGTEIWVMKDFGDSRSWSKIYNFNHRHPVLGFPTHYYFFLENGMVLTECNGSKNKILYDPKNQAYKILDFASCVEVVRYSESLVSVERGGSISNDDSNHCASTHETFFWSRLDPRKWRCYQ